MHPMASATTPSSPNARWRSANGWPRAVPRRWWWPATRPPRSRSRWCARHSRSPSWASSRASSRPPLASRSRVAGVLATAATLRSARFEALIERYAADLPLPAPARPRAGRGDRTRRHRLARAARPARRLPRADARRRRRHAGARLHALPLPRRNDPRVDAGSSDPDRHERGHRAPARPRARRARPARAGRHARPARRACIRPTTAAACRRSRPRCSASTRRSKPSRSPRRAAPTRPCRPEPACLAPCHGAMTFLPIPC